jgi:hypothetical protein
MKNAKILEIKELQKTQAYSKKDMSRLFAAAFSPKD